MEDVYNYASYIACASELEFGEFKSQAPVGEKAPNFTLRTLKGGEVTLADFHGSYLVLDFGSIT